MSDQPKEFKPTLEQIQHIKELHDSNPMMKDLLELANKAHKQLVADLSKKMGISEEIIDEAVKKSQNQYIDSLIYETERPAPAYDGRLWSKEINSRESLDV